MEGVGLVIVGLFGLVDAGLVVVVVAPEMTELRVGLEMKGTLLGGDEEKP
jgi:hypothetical protein